MRLNGKTDDWQPHLEEALGFEEEHLLFSAESYNHKSLHYRHLTGVRGDYLYAIFLVTDDKVVYRKADSPCLDISESGQIRSTIVPISSEDEIGDLSRTLTPCSTS